MEAPELGSTLLTGKNYNCCSVFVKRNIINFVMFSVVCLGIM